MDELDRKLIVELQNDPRQSNTHLASVLGIVEATVRRRIEHLVSSGTLILTALPDLKKFGLPTRVYILFQADHSKIDEIGEQLCQISYLRFVSTCMGIADFFIRGDFASIEALADFLMDDLGKIKNISRIETLLEYKQLKKTYNRIGFPRSNNTASPQTGVIGISEADCRLILQLQRNAHAPLKELAQCVGVSEATIHRRIKDLVGSGTVELTAIPNVSKVGYPAQCFIGIQTEPAKMRHVAESIVQYPQVTYVGIFSGPIQTLVGIHASSNDALSEFVTQEILKIKGIIRIETFTNLKVLKQNYTWLQ